MITISAFADEISPDPQEQINVLKGCGVSHIEFRSILKTNVLMLGDLQIQEFKSLLQREGFHLSAIGSPIGKVRVDEPMEGQIQKLHRAIELCKIFDTPNIRIFSFYPTEGQEWDALGKEHEAEVFSRLEQLTAIAAKNGVRLLHENEHRIYGDSPERVEKLLTHFAGVVVFKGVYDAANFVFGGYDPWRGWEVSRDHVAHLHIKDWLPGAEHGSIAGEGAGRIPDVMRDALARGYSGFATMEPHLLGGGPTGGVTGPDLFPKAVRAFQGILDNLGAAYS